VDTTIMLELIFNVHYL